MEEIVIVIIAFMLMGLGIETGWVLHRARYDRIIRQKNKTIADLEADGERLRQMLIEGQRSPAPVTGATPLYNASALENQTKTGDMLSRIPRFSDDEPIEFEHESDRSDDREHPDSAFL